MRRLLAGVAALALGAGLLTAGAATAQAAPMPGLVGSVLLKGAPLDPNAVVDEGTALTLRVQYDNAASPLAGETFAFELGSIVTVNGVPAGNEAIASITQGEAPNENTVLVTFKDPWPAGVGQGYFDLSFVVNNTEGTSAENLTWSLGDETTTIPIVVKNSGDEIENVREGFAKSNSRSNLNSFVTMENGVFEGLSAEIIGQTVPYTLTVNTPKGTAREGFEISDALPAGLSYVGDSFAAQLTSWDANGYNRATATFPFAPETDGRSFTQTVDLPESSILMVTYQATVKDEAERVLLEDLLRAQYAALNGASGNFSIALTNTATFGGPGTNTRTSQVDLRGTVAGPGTGSAFSKDASWVDATVITGDDGTVVNDAGDPSPAGIVYTLKADLRQWDDRNINYTLDRNVVISDNLPVQASWLTESADFMSIVSGTSPDFATLSPVGACVSIADFAADEFVGKYCVDGQTLRINVGKSAQTNVAISAPAQLNTVAGLSVNGTSTIEGATRYELRNIASFTYRAGDAYNAGWSSFPVALPEDRSAGLNDSSAFSKAGPSGAITATPGEPVAVDYTFRVNTAKTGVSAADTRIVDYVDEQIFALGDVASLPVTGRYDNTNLSATDFSVTRNAAGNLVIELSTAGSERVSALTAGKTLTVNLSLTTKPFEGKQTIDITNRASLFGVSDVPLYWSQAGSRSTSYGNESEVRKHIFDRASDQWSKDLSVAADAEGNLLEEVYVYRIQMLGHGEFGGIKILDVKDMLPETTEFLGFVNEADVATGANPVAGPVSVGANLTATFDPTAGDSGTVTISQASGTFPQGGEASAYFAVRIAQADAPIVNSIGDISASITPVGPANIDIEKWSDEGETPQYDAAGALLNDGFAGDFDEAPGKALAVATEQIINFTVSNNGADALRGVTVSDTLDSGTGEITNLVCVFPDDSEGVQWGGPFLPATQFSCTGTMPKLAAGEAHADTATVVGTGIVSGTVVEDSDTWNGAVAATLPEDGATAKPGAGTPAAGALSATGSDSMPWFIALAGALVVAGGALVLRRRRMSAE